MKRTLAASALIVCALAFSYGQRPGTVIDSSKYSAYWWHSKDLFDHLPDTKNEIVFLGNSITDGAEWFELLDNKRCRNRGISGDVTAGVLLRLDAVTKLKPSGIFIMIGINDLSRNVTVDSVMVNYRLILDQIKRETPGTKVFIESLLPVNPAVGRYPALQNKTELIMELNRRLRDLALEFSYTYIDLFSLMADAENQLPRKYSLDGLHLSYEGYRVWTEAIRKYVK
jgi:lysophospholipase L1-like esterase